MRKLLFTMLPLCLMMSLGVDCTCEGCSSGRQSGSGGCTPLEMNQPNGCRAPFDAGKDARGRTGSAGNGGAAGFAGHGGSGASGGAGGAGVDASCLSADAGGCHTLGLGWTCRFTALASGVECATAFDGGGTPGSCPCALDAQPLFGCCVLSVPEPDAGPDASYNAAVCYYAQEAGIAAMEQCEVNAYDELPYTWTLSPP